MISFIVPAHNEEGYLGPTLAAIHRSARGAAGEAYEVIVVDDASTDRTAAVAREGGAEVIAVDHRQIAATRNRGAWAARGDRLFFVDADTVIHPEIVSAALGAMDHGAVGGGAPARLDGAVPLYARLLLFWYRFFTRIAGVCGGAFLFTTREAFDLVGGFDERLFGAEDAAFCAALKREGRFALLWDSVETSGRRVRSTSGLRILGLFVGMALMPRRTLARRESVQRIWYESDRESEEHTSWRMRASNAVALAIMIAVLTAPVWLLPLPPALAGGWTGVVQSGVRIVCYHAALLLLPGAYFLLRNAVRQKSLAERGKTLVMLAACLAAGLAALREVVRFWSGV